MRKVLFFIFFSSFQFSDGKLVPYSYIRVKLTHLLVFYSRDPIKRPPVTFYGKTAIYVMNALILKGCYIPFRL